MKQVHEFLASIGFVPLNVKTDDDSLEHWIHWNGKTVIAIAPGNDIAIVTGSLPESTDNKLSELLIAAFEPDPIRNNNMKHLRTVILAALVLPRIETTHYSSSELCDIMRKAGGLLIRAHSTAPHQYVNVIAGGRIYFTGNGFDGSIDVTSLKDAPSGWQLSRDLGRTWERAVKYVQSDGKQVRVFRGV